MVVNSGHRPEGTVARDAGHRAIDAERTVDRWRSSAGERQSDNRNMRWLVST